MIGLDYSLVQSLKLNLFEVSNVEIFASNSSPGNFGRHLFHLEDFRF